MSDTAERALTALLQLMARLRDPETGCPWDQKQTFATIAPFTIEEAYEVADAIERGDPQQLRDELGDLLFQVVFHAQLAQERGWFDFAQVADSIHDKLVRRHPHVFAGKSVQNAAELSRNWEEQKARERAAGGAEVSALADVPRGLPALTRAAKLGKRAGRVGFDWPDAAGVRDKVLEESGEVDAAIASGSSPAIVEEMGDLLFAAANWSRHLRVDAEEALRAANSKFERRFQTMESLARARGLSLGELTPQAWEGLWQEASWGKNPFRRHSWGPPYRALMGILRTSTFRRLGVALACLAVGMSLALDAEAAAVVSKGAAEVPDNEVVAEASTVSMDQAVKMAEQRFKARVVRAESQHEGVHTIYILRLLNDAGHVWTVRVDATNGAIL